MSMLFVPPSMPYMVPEAEALTESECLSLAGLSSSELDYTVVTCETTFDVTVSVGQRLHIQNPNGGSHNMLPVATLSNTGTYQYIVPDGWASGTIRLVLSVVIVVTSLPDPNKVIPADIFIVSV